MDVLCIGEALIDFVSSDTGVSVGDSSGFVKAAGGGPANVAVSVSRLGKTSGFLGKVGDDPFGRFLQRTLAGDRVDTKGMCFETEARTGLAFVSLQADGERDFSFFRHPSADMLFRPEELEVSLLRNCRALHFGTISLIQEPSRTTTLAAIQIAREHGAIISCDPNLRLPLWPDAESARVWMRKALDLADFAKLSAEEVTFLREKEGVEGLQEWYDDPSRPDLSVVTCGQRGCFFASGDACFAAHPGYVVDAIDTTGAGDGFVGAFLARLLDFIESVEQLRTLSESALAPICAYANAAGALTTTRKGAIPALPTAAEVDAFLEANQLVAV